MCLISSFWTHHPAHLLLQNDPGRWRNAAVEIEWAVLVQVRSELGVMWHCWKLLLFQEPCFKTYIINCAAEKTRGFVSWIFCIKSRLAHSDQLFLHEELSFQDHISLCSFVSLLFCSKGWVGNIQFPIFMIHMSNWQQLWTCVLIHLWIFMIFLTREMNVFCLWGLCWLYCLFHFPGGLLITDRWFISAQPAKWV